MRGSLTPFPESSNIKVSYDGKDLEVMGKGKKHEKSKRLLGKIVDIIVEEMGIPVRVTRRRPGSVQSSRVAWKRMSLFTFSRKSLTRRPRPMRLDSKDVADYPNPDLTVEVDISRLRSIARGSMRPFALRKFGFGGQNVVIERLTQVGTYEAVEASGFLPVSAEDIRRWVTDYDTRNQTDWFRRLRAEIKTRVAGRI